MKTIEEFHEVYTRFLELKEEERACERGSSRTGKKIGLGPAQKAELETLRKVEFVLADVKAKDKT